MKNKSIIFNIHNKNNIKLVFSYLDFQYILKLTKNNKRLQKILGINLEIYKNKSNPKYVLEKKKDSKNYYFLKKSNILPNNRLHYINFLLLFFLYNIIFLIYTLIYTIILVIKDTFNEKNAKENYEKKFKIIKIINLSIFAYITIIILTVYIFIFQFEWISLIKIILLILINLINILFEILIIWKLILSYKIKKNGITWFMRMDYSFIFFNFIYNLLSILGIFIYYYYYIIPYHKFLNHHTFYFITSFNNIKINDYKVSNDFLKMNEKEKTQFLLNNYKNMEYINTNDEKNLITMINAYREKNNLPILKFNKKLKLNDYIKESSEIMINPEQNLFIEDKEYLFKYPIGDFEKEFKNKNYNILAVLQKENLNYIKIITKDNFEFIYICELPNNNFESLNISN